MPGKGSGKSHRPAAIPVRREYTAAVRYGDGRSEIFHVRDALGVDEVRAMIKAELMNVRLIMVSVHYRVHGSC